jgi:hypothetical protein
MGHRRAFGMLVMAAAVGLLAGCGQAQSQAKAVVLDSFEKAPDPSVSRQVYDLAESLKKPELPVDDYGWITSGYVSLEPFNKYATQGKLAAKARFTVPGDFKKPGQQPKTWEAGMTLSTDSPTKLEVTDWASFKFLAIDVFNPDNKEYQGYLRVTDSHSAITQTAGLIKAKGKSVLFMEVTRLAEARLDVHDIKALTLYLDTVDQPVDPVLYLDNVRLTSAPNLR